MKEKLALLCILCCMVISGCSTIFPGDKSKMDDLSVLTVDRIYGQNEFKAESFGPARWLEDGTGYTTLEKSEQIEDGKDIVRYHPVTGKRDILVTARQLTPPGDADNRKPLKIDNYSWADDGKKLLIFTNTKKVWRQNTRGDYWLFDLTSGILQQLGGRAESSTMMFAKFSPDGTKVAYVCKRNLFIQNLADLSILQLTIDGSETIVNGTSDWVYEEEFGLRDGFRWSPDSQYIAYWQFDMQGVRNFHMINNTDELYSKIITVQYPKVGQTNSACKIGIVSAAGGVTQWLDVPGDPRNHYIPKMQWIPESDQVVLQQLNRLQNTNKVMRGNIHTGEVSTILTDKDDAWIDIKDNWYWMDDGTQFTWLSEKSGWRHIYHVSRDSQNETLLTPGFFDVISITHIDQNGGWVYYIASPDNPTRRYLYRSSLDGSGKAQRLTPVDQPGMHSYQMSQDSRWAIHTYSRTGSPAVIDLIALPQHERVRTLEDNQELKEKVAVIAQRPVEFFRVDIGDGILLDGWCIKPSDFNPRKKYPLLFHVYGEPAGQTVLDRWGGNNYLWHLMLAQQGYIVVSVDNRGTPAPRGRAWRKSVYRQIGILASADQAAAVREIIRTWPFVDSERIGIWGWSGGGSMTLNAMFRYPDLYTTGIAIAFISNQKYYDTIYQERYMGLPDDNEEGFKNGSPINFAHQLKGNLLIIHGTGDDNCHYQNFEALVNELIEHNKHFTMLSYPNRTHGISEGKNTRRHLFGMMTRYLHENLPAGPR